MVSIIAWTVVETFFIVQLFKVFNKKNHQEAIKAIESEAEGVSYTPSYTSDIPAYICLHGFNLYPTREYHEEYFIFYIT